MSWGSIVKFDSREKQLSSDSYLTTQKQEDGYIQFNIHYGTFGHTEVIFIHEGVRMVVDSNVTVDFYDSEKNLLASVTETPPTEGRRRYLDISCKVEGDKIYFRFPYYDWVDHYPYCDGENDRWDAYVTGYRSPFVFDCRTREIVVASE